MNLSSIKIPQQRIEEELLKRTYNKINEYFPDEGELSRDKYEKHMEFFRQGKKQRERTMMAANRVGKTEGAGGYEIVLHAIGKYPNWWEGRRFDKPVNVLVGGETSKLVRDSIQLKLLGPLHDMGSGLIPRDNIADTTPKSGVPDAIDTVYIRHPKGTSIIQFQSYDQGREVFQATERDIVWFDEEPPEDIYAEGLIRTMTTKGMVISTFTPLKGMTKTIQSLREKAANGDGVIITLTWDDVPHLSQEDKDQLWRSLPPYQRDARSKGVPRLGAGAIYPVSEATFVIEPIEIPKHFKRAYGMDVGWNNTAALWGAYDDENDVLYITHEYKRGEAEPAVHASTIKARGDWIRGVIDPASRGRAQKDGEQLIKLYRKQGLDLTEADNGVESGIFDVYERLTSGRLKVFSTCVGFLEEFRLYRRDDKGRVVKEFDHIMDALRYLVKSGRAVATVNVTKTPKSFGIHGKQTSWMG